MTSTATSQKDELGSRAFAQLQRLGKSIMLPIAVLPAAGIPLRLGQDDLLGGIDAPIIFAPRAESLKDDINKAL